MPDHDERSGCSVPARILLLAIVALALGVIAFILYTGIDGPDPASQNPIGAAPPRGEPMAPLD